MPSSIQRLILLLGSVFFSHLGICSLDRVATFSGTVDPDAFGILRSVLSTAFSPDGKTWVSGTYDGTIRVRFTQSGRAFRTFHTLPYDRLRLSPDGQKMASASTPRGMIRLWSVKSGRLLAEFKASVFREMSFDFSPDGTKLIFLPREPLKGDSRLELWDLKEETHRFTFFFENSRWGEPHTVKFSPDGEEVISLFWASHKQHGVSVRIWETQTGLRLRSFATGLSAPRGMSLSNDGKKIAVWDGSSLEVRDLQTGHLLHSIPSIHVVSSQFGKKNQLLIGTEFGTVFVWDVENTPARLIDLVQTITHQDYLRSLSFSPDGNLVLVGKGNGKLDLFQFRPALDHSK